ncbi:MAG: hypothetical protein CMJ32_03180 [Phycisphaerae bacterium]|nr:hypothetical protein [Phycisphaerae bacterium]
MNNHSFEHTQIDRVRSILKQMDQSIDMARNRRMRKFQEDAQPAEPSKSMFDNETPRLKAKAKRPSAFNTDGWKQD